MEIIPEHITVIMSLIGANLKENIMKIKAGQKIRVKTAERLMEEYGFPGIEDINRIKIPFGFNENMCMFCDKIAIVERVFREEVIHDTKTRKLKLRFLDKELEERSDDWTFGSQMVVPYQCYDFQRISHLFESNIYEKSILELLDIV